MLPGCETAGKAVDTGGEKTRALIGKIEPTGTLESTRAETEARRELWESACDRLNELDVETLNQTIAELQALAGTLLERLEAVPPAELAALREDVAASAAALRAQLDEASLPQTTTAVLNLAETFDAKVKVLEPERINLLLEQAGTAIDELIEAVRSLDHNLVPALEETQQLVRNADTTIQDLPTDELRQTVVGLQETVTRLQTSVDKLPEVTREAQATLGAVRLTARVATVVLIVVGLCGLIWLARRGARRSA